MTKILRIELVDEQLEGLRTKAAQLQIQPEELAKAGIVDLLQRSDLDFEAAAEKMLKKNAELYRRLA